MKTSHNIFALFGTYRRILDLIALTIAITVPAIEIDANEYNFYSDPTTTHSAKTWDFTLSNIDATYYRNLRVEYDTDLTPMFIGYLTGNYWRNYCNGNVMRNGSSSLNDPPAGVNAHYSDSLSSWDRSVINLRFAFSSGTLSNDSVANIKVYGTKDPPTATAQSTSVNENSSTGLTNFNISDPQGASMTVYVTSGPSHASSFTWSGTQFNYTPTSCYHGSDSFQYYVKENVQGQASSTVTVTITVNQINFPPTINAISNASAPWYGPSTVNFSGVTAGACGGTIAVSATSSNTGVLPNPTVSYTSPSATGTLTLTPGRPVTTQTGTSTVTVTVSDGVNNPVNTTFTASVPWVTLLHK